jgi:hypothetical protein
MRFTIRDLLWLTLLAAVAVAWWIDRGRQTVRADRLTEEIRLLESAVAELRPAPDLNPIFSEDTFTSRSIGD